MNERLEAWQCIGCGRIEAPRPCIGVCQDKPVELAYGADLDVALAQAERLRRENARLRSLLAQFTGATPRNGAWKRSYLAFQARARALLGASGGG